jgi:CheY-like chemotaxis protein
MGWEVTPSASDDETLQRRKKVGSPPSLDRWSINVLLVEDDMADTSLILNVLRRHANVSTAHASNAPDLTLQQLAEGRMAPDLILLDIRMPKIDGFEFLDRLRHIPTMGDVPVVFLTTSRLASDVIEARHSSAVFYVIKPESYHELQSRLDGVIQKTLSGAWRK